MFSTHVSQTMLHVYGCIAILPLAHFLSLRPLLHAARPSLAVSQATGYRHLVLCRCMAVRRAGFVWRPAKARGYVQGAWVVRGKTGRSGEVARVAGPRENGPNQTTGAAQAQARRRHGKASCVQSPSSSTQAEWRLLRCLLRGLRAGLVAGLHAPGGARQGRGREAGRGRDAILTLGAAITPGLAPRRPRPPRSCPCPPPPGSPAP